VFYKVCFAKQSHSAFIQVKIFKQVAQGAASAYAPAVNIAEFTPSLLSPIMLAVALMPFTSTTLRMML
jgi:hypothetical protein